MADANGWINYGVGLLWLIVFIVFIVASYPQHKGGSKK